LQSASIFGYILCILGMPHIFFRCIPLIPLFTILALSQSFSHWPVVIIVSVSFWIASVIILFYVLFLCLLHQFLQNLLTRIRQKRKEQPLASCIPMHIYICIYIYVYIYICVYICPTFWYLVSISHLVPKVPVSCTENK